MWLRCLDPTALPSEVPSILCPSSALSRVGYFRMRKDANCGAALTTAGSESHTCWQSAGPAKKPAHAIMRTGITTLNSLAVSAGPAERPPHGQL